MKQGKDLTRVFEVRVASPRGFCAGVDRAIEIVNRALTQFGAPVFVRHEVVHNKHVVQDLRERGAIFVEEVREIPEGALCIFSAHGVSQQVRRDAEARGLRVFDATCPLVTKVHLEVSKAARRIRYSFDWTRRSPRGGRHPGSDRLGCQRPEILDRNR